MKSYDVHRASGSSKIRCSVITVSTSRYIEASKGHKVDDVSGLKIAEKLMQNGHIIVSRKIVSDDIYMIRNETLRSIYEEDCSLVILTGGTGVTSSDVTIEALSPLFEKELPGFGEVFRAQTFLKAKGVALISRAKAGIIASSVVFCVPGSPDAADVAMDIIVDELPHIIKHARE